MSHFVLDASLALRWFLEDPVDEYAHQVRRLLMDGSRALVPVIWNLEMVNTLVGAERKGKITAAAVDDRLADIEDLLASYIDTQIEVISARSTLNAARTFGLTAYDASYLVLAQTEKLPLATLDAQLLKASERAGVQILR